MNDKELLELATKAAGFAYDADTEKHWNPLTNDGDALHLAVKLKIDIRPSMSGSSKFRYAVYNGLTYGEVDSDPYAATRRAIVRAAASSIKSANAKGE